MIFTIEVKGKHLTFDRKIFIISICLNNEIIQYQILTISIRQNKGYFEPLDVYVG